VLASPTSIGNEPRINFGMTVIDPSLGGLFLRRLCRSTPRLVFNRRPGYSSPSATADKTVDPRNAKLPHDMGAGLVPDYHAQHRPAGDKAAPTRLARIAGAPNRFCRRLEARSKSGRHFSHHPDSGS
jgi:hypothetical protein